MKKAGVSTGYKQVGVTIDVIPGLAPTDSLPQLLFDSVGRTPTTPGSAWHQLVIFEKNEMYFEDIWFLYLCVFWSELWRFGSFDAIAAIHLGTFWIWLRYMANCILLSFSRPRVWFTFCSLLVGLDLCNTHLAEKNKQSTNNRLTTINHMHIRHILRIYIYICHAVYIMIIIYNVYICSCVACQRPPPMVCSPSCDYY